MCTSGLAANVMKTRAIYFFAMVHSMLVSYSKGSSWALMVHYSAHFLGNPIKSRAAHLQK